MLLKLKLLQINEKKDATIRNNHVLKVKTSYLPPVGRSSIICQIQIHIQKILFLKLSRPKNDKILEQMKILICDVITSQYGGRVD